MTPAEFKSAREALGFTQGALAEEWGMTDNGSRAIRRWESGSTDVPPIVAYCLRLMMESFEA